MTHCPKCGRPEFDGRTNRVDPRECAHPDGIGCRAFLHGVEVGKLLTQGANGVEARAFLEGFNVGTLRGHERAEG